MTVPDFRAALDPFAKLLGDERVIRDDAELDAASTATFETSARIRGILCVQERAEVAECLQLASRLGVPLYPISAGKNWGLGSRVPPGGDALLLDLSRMNRIVDFDEELAFVTLEPGVTFQQLYEFLRARKSRLFANTTGGSPHASVVGNALERGDGTGPYGDRVNHVCALEVVLPSGRCVHTGFDRFDGTPLAQLQRWGVGPALDGLFSQSNLGVVTRLTLWLSPLPKSLSAVRFRIHDPARLPGMVDALRRLRQDGTLRSVAGIWNDYRVLSVNGRFPFDKTAGATPLGREVVAELAQQWGGATWFGLTALYAGSEAQGRAHAAHVEALLGAAVDELEIQTRSGEPVSGQELFHEREPAFQFLQGIPHEGSLRSVYWRKRAEPSAALDPDHDRCGVVWLCPALPYRGRDAARAAEISECLLLEHGFDPLIAMVAHSERCLYFIPLIIFDRDEPGADQRGMACHDALVQALASEGNLLYRLGIQSMDALPLPRDDYLAILRSLKQLFDPADILSPGHYDFRNSWPEEG